MAINGKTKVEVLDRRTGERKMVTVSALFKNAHGRYSNPINPRLARLVEEMRKAGMIKI